MSYYTNINCIADNGWQLKNPKLFFIPFKQFEPHVSLIRAPSAIGLAVSGLAQLWQHRQYLN